MVKVDLHEYENKTCMVCGHKETKIKRLMIKWVLNMFKPEDIYCIKKKDLK